MHRSHAVPAFLSLLSAACVSDAPTAMEPGAVHMSQAAPMVVATLTEGFIHPESALYDRGNDAYLISEVGPSVFGPEADGAVLVLQPDGTIPETLIDGLISPTGMALVGGVLFVADRGGVEYFDRATGEHLGTAALEVATFLNDICAAPGGRVYATGTALAEGMDNYLFEIRDGELVTLASGASLALPNGCVAQGARNVYFTSFTEEGGIYRLNASGKVSQVLTGEQTPGQIDSAIPLGNAWYLASWEGGGVFRVSRGGTSTERIAAIPTPADMDFDARRNRLLVPSLNPFEAQGSFSIVALP